MSPPRHYVRLVQRRPFDFLWSSRNEPVGSVKEGGVGVVSIRLKWGFLSSDVGSDWRCSLLLMQVSKVVLNTDSPWVGFGHTFLGLRLARLNCYQFSNKHHHYRLSLSHWGRSRGSARRVFYSLRVNAFIVCCRRQQLWSCTSLDPTTLKVCFKLAHDVLADLWTSAKCQGLAPPSPRVGLVLQYLRDRPTPL